ncbi:MAG: hypothetical protein K0S01_68 [Herbinix sp.]|jgi:hypothetical protein|nr:hypothetical protein [Herbinix sp.]
MEDTNKSQVPQEPASEQPFDAPQSTGSSSVNESTYWEGSLQKLSSQEPVPNEESMQNEDTKPGYLQPDISQPWYPSNGTFPSSPKKKSHGKLIAVIILLLLLLSGAATAFAFQDTLMNTFALMTKSPAQYYAYVEKNAIQESIDKVKPNLNMSPKKIAYDASMDITFNREALDSLMQSTLGVSMTNLESYLGLPIENIGVDVLAGYDGGLLNETLGVRLNQVNLITMDLFMDTLKQEIFLRLPELSNAYLKESLNTGDTSTNFSITQLEKLTPERTADLLNRYGSILVENITQVELEKNNILTLDTLSVKCSKLTVTLTQEDSNAIAMAFLDEAREDAYIIDMLPMFNTTTEEYQQAIDDAKNELQTSGNTIMEDQTLQMIVYVDNRGNIIGRDLSTAGSSAAVGYTNLSNKDYDEFNLYLKDDTGNTILKGTGNQTKDQGAYDGTITVDYNNPSTEPLTNLSFDIKYEDVRTETKDNHIYQYGSYTLSSLDLMGLQIMMENSVAQDTQYNKIIFQMGASPLVTIDTKANYLDDYTVEMPPETAEIYDATQSESYLSSLDIVSYISRLSEELGIDLNSLLGLFQNDLSIE